MIDVLGVNSYLYNFEEGFVERHIILPKIKKILKKFLSIELIEKMIEVCLNCGLN